MTDLVKRARQEACVDEGLSGVPREQHLAWLMADEIEKLRAENERLDTDNRNVEALRRDVALWKACTENALNQRDSAEVRTEQGMLNGMREWTPPHGCGECDSDIYWQKNLDAYERDRLKKEGA